MSKNKLQNIFITGGAGYVGAVLVPKLLRRGYSVTVLDLMIYGEEVLPNHPKLTKIKGDIRDQEILKKNLPGHDAVIHLACISNDPSFDLNPELGKSINLDAFEPLVQISQEAGVKRFIYASSSSVYGIKDEPNVTEEMSLEPLTDYSKFKAMCEEILAKYQSETFTTVTIRPSTVCGYSPRQRLDLVVNILTNLAINKGEITVFGGEQKRPNIHIEDMTDLYCILLELPDEKIAGKIYNAGYENHPVGELAEIVKKVVGPQVKVITSPTDDLRSYHVSSQKIKEEIGFEARHTIDDAVKDLKIAFDNGMLPEPLTDPRYFNVKLMQKIDLK
ncbi:MAG: SDR family oxidoreductase [Bacteroidia bacterium]|nr:SDR family oxidoreductase [Bacteroidia bacterium]